jgi:hypothetical protein
MFNDGVPGCPGRALSAGLIAALWACALATAPVARSDANDTEGLALPKLTAKPDVDDQGYSYYYVPSLSELNQIVGSIFRSGRVRVAAPGADTPVTRYVAYSCEGTLHLSGEDDHEGAYDVDWSAVANLRSESDATVPTLVVEKRPSPVATVRPLVLRFSDATARAQLHEALAVLVTECRKTLWGAPSSAPRAQR